MTQSLVFLGFSFSLFFIFNSNASANSIDAIAVHSKALENRTRLELENASIRWNHAKELLGKRYRKSVVRSGERVSSLDEFLSAWTKKGLPKKWKKYSAQIAHTIIQQSKKYSFDPIFLMAVIENESSFNPEAIGPCGEIGLMQLTLDTAKFITNRYNIPFKDKKALKDPIFNIQLGATYLAYLRERFDSESDLYIAAYNMGSANVNKAINRNSRPKVYPTRVMQRYLKFYNKLKNEIEKS